jgi:hypothetical protein
MRPVTFVVLILAMITTGCGSNEFDLAPVRGLVTLDGKPIAGARVIFEPQRSGKDALSAGPGSDGKTDEEGRYSLLTTVERQRGAVVGQHTVTISTYLAEVDRTRDIGRVTRVEEIPSRYFEPGALSFEVPPEGSESADFSLQTK